MTVPLRSIKKSPQKIENKNLISFMKPSSHMWGYLLCLIENHKSFSDSN